MGQGEVSAHPNLLGEPLPVELMNTVSIEDGELREDDLDAAGAAAWMDAVSHRLPMTASGSTAARTTRRRPGTTRADDRLRELRDALRVLAAEATEDPRYPAEHSGTQRREAVATLNRLNRFAPTWPELVWGTHEEPVRRLGSTADARELAVSLIAHEAVELFTSAQRNQLRPCVAPGCHRYFLKQHSRREWCTPVCGNRARVARHYRRHNTQSSKYQGGTGTPDWPGEPRASVL
jgi:predicted RNA-binding Zn ribbon-like protein